MLHLVARLLFLAILASGPANGDDIGGVSLHRRRLFLDYDTSRRARATIPPRVRASAGDEPWLRSSKKDRQYDHEDELLVGVTNTTEDASLGSSLSTKDPTNGLNLVRGLSIAVAGASCFASALQRFNNHLAKTPRKRSKTHSKEAQSTSSEWAGGLSILRAFSIAAASASYVFYVSFLCKGYASVVQKFSRLFVTTPKEPVPPIRDVPSVPVPLSVASVTDKVVHNDTLKVIMLGSSGVEKTRLARAIQGSNELLPLEHSALSVNVLEWTPATVDSLHPVKFKIWDINGGATGSNCVDFGLHEGTQSLFFSPGSLYVLVWDMACHRSDTNLIEHNDAADNHDVIEEANLLADMALRADISERVLAWIDCVARNASNSILLPVAVIPEGMTDLEVKRRYDMMNQMLQEHTRQLGADKVPPRLLMDITNGVYTVKYQDCASVERVQEAILAASTGRSGTILDRIGAAVPYGTMLVLEAIRRFKRSNHKIVEMAMLLGELRASLHTNDIVKALCFLSGIGEIMYFGGSHNHTRDSSDVILSRYVVLCRAWMVSALSCVLKDNLKQGVSVARHMVQAMGIGSGEEQTKNEVMEALAGSSASNCPVLSANDVKVLWMYKRFMKEVADRCSQFTDSTDASLFCFLERVLVRTGIFVPLETSPNSSSCPSEAFFVPSCLSEPKDGCDVWTYKSRESWRTTLCHWLTLHSGTPSNIMEDITVNLLRDLTELSTTVSGSSATAFYDVSAPIDIKIHQVMCWKSSLMVKIGATFMDGESEQPLESTVELYVAISDTRTSGCIASHSAGVSTKRVVISGKGNAGNHGQKLWNGGYRVALNSVLSTVSHCMKFSSLDWKVDCPDCLARLNPQDADSWSFSDALRVAESSNSKVCCRMGHRIDGRLLCGTISAPKEDASNEFTFSHRAIKRVQDIASSVVIVAVWDPDMKRICSIGSGFIADAKLGLVVTAAHVLYAMEDTSELGKFGDRHGGNRTTVVVGVIPPGQDCAQFRYVADVVASDVPNVDATILRIRSRIASGEDETGPANVQQLLGSIRNDVYDVQDEDLPALEMTTHFELEENVRIIGYNQGGEGVFSELEHVDNFVDYAKGHICKRFRTTAFFDNGTHHSKSQMTFEPRGEIVVDSCRTIKGHSGGPCVNDQGEVVGILSRSDPSDSQRCYVVPSMELIGLMSQAERKCAS